MICETTLKQVKIPIPVSLCCLGCCGLGRCDQRGVMIMIVLLARKTIPSLQYFHDFQHMHSDNRGRDNWGGRDRGSSRRDYGRDYGRSRDRYSPNRHDMSPPIKRMRQEW